MVASNLNLCVVIPTRNRGTLLASVVAHLKECGVTRIIVVDDASVDPVSLEGVKLIRNSKRMGYNFCANVGVLKAESDWVFLLADDIYPPRSLFDALENLASTADVIGFPIAGEGVPKTKGVIDFMFNISSGVPIPRHTSFCSYTTGAMVMKKSAFMSVGGFHWRKSYQGGFRGESELQFRLRRAGFRILHVASISVDHVFASGGYEKKNTLRNIGFELSSNHVEFVGETQRNSFLRSVEVTSFSLYLVLKGVPVLDVLKGIAEGLRRSFAYRVD